MKTSIDSSTGVVTTESGNGITLEGQDYCEAPFDKRWDDLYAVIDEGTGQAALTYEAYRDTGFYMKFFRHSQDDNIFMRYQMTHQWDPTSAVQPHVHLIPMSSGSGVVKFDYAYSWCNVNGVLPSASGWVSGSVSASYTPADQYKQKVIGFGTLTPPSGSHESAMLIFKVERPGSSDTSDTYSTAKDHGTASANVAILFFDLHFQKSKAGTKTPFPEN